ncbi:hypothetical protein MRX96_039499 [Rhipicephalus microplus]
MTASECLGYGLMGFGPALSMFALTIARHPSRVVVLLLSSFSWTLSLLLSSLAWFVLSPLGSSLDVVVAIAVLFQEGARLATLQALRKADHSLAGCARRRCATGLEQGCAGVCFGPRLRRCQWSLLTAQPAGGHCRCGSSSRGRGYRQEVRLMVAPHGTVSHRDSPRWSLRIHMP